ncbi:hypothetical protein NBRC10512_000501 [Rhodotorula toruloides]|uniref:RHTO0S04e09296g1_1 n=2 Tax=Rhodotorula toruloides TaxID=5286 RepID=A0A061AQD7_RHOTO|nr:uncharacterized protein RHTO_05215 [Rhodotorula toruloides NP11]EMS19268.1 hypothetical protein RHTO_05215 [Rhodotorula toruloides NP11]CDR39780.1 RHTO0S04e09296g1_1 [Rhodotorula toruloides]
MTARLPPELFALVLEHVTRSLKNPRPFLAACSLLDRNYGQEAQRILFKRCSRLRQPERVEGWLASPYSVATEALVVWFPPPDHRATDDDLLCASFGMDSRLARVLGRCAALQGLHVHLTKTVSPAFLTKVPLTSLERLEISAEAGYFDPLRRKPIGTLRLDSLTSLTIGGDVHQSLLFSLHKYCTRLTHLDCTRNGESTDPVRAYDLCFTQEVSNLTRLTYFQLDGPICGCCYYALVLALPPTLETLAFRTEEHDILADLLQATIFFKQVFGGTLGHPVVPNLKLLVLPKKVKRLLPLDAINGAAKRGIALRFTRPKPSD